MQDGCLPLKDLVHRLIEEFRSRIGHCGFLTTCSQMSNYVIGGRTWWYSDFMETTKNFFNGHTNRPLQRVAPARCYFLALMNFALRRIFGYSFLRQDIFRQAWDWPDLDEEPGPNLRIPDICAIHILKEIPSRPSPSAMWRRRLASIATRF